jgi:glyoxylase I family protein
MERVLGIGGVFFRAADPESLSRWYAEHLGVDPPPASYDTSSWRQEGGATVFSGLPEDSSHFPADRTWAVTFRVRDLDAMTSQLLRAGIEVQRDGATYPNGVFATLVDPEGNGIQLWEAAGSDA